VLSGCQTGFRQQPPLVNCVRVGANGCAVTVGDGGDGVAVMVAAAGGVGVSVAMRDVAVAASCAAACARGVTGSGDGAIVLGVIVGWIGGGEEGGAVCVVPLLHATSSRRAMSERKRALRIRLPSGVVDNDPAAEMNVRLVT